MKRLLPPGLMSALLLPPPSRSPWQRLYAGGHRLRRRWWSSRARRLPRPVVSVGNLHWGGTGKTPLVAAIAEHLRDQGLAVAVLSRGYLSRGRGVRVVSTGDGPLLGPTVAGDEPVLLAGELPGVAVVVSPDRFAAGRHALERLSPPPDLFLLDDGFSHLRLERDLDLLAFPAADPFGGGRLPPGGRLREPLAAAARADAVLLTGGEPPAGRELAVSLRQVGFRGPGFTSRTRPLPARQATGQALPPGARVLLVAGIARPARFVAAAREQGLELADILTFKDHHEYGEETLREIHDCWQRSGAQWVLLTSKDRVKLLGRLDLPLAELPIRAEPEPALWHWLGARLGELSQRKEPS